MKKIFTLLAALCVVAGVVAKTPAKPKVIAHRGYWMAEGSAQNSLTSFRKADAVGCFGSEIDVWYTKDNKLVVNHDRVFQGVKMEEGTAKEIMALTLPNGETIPSLEAYLKEVQKHPNTRLIYEAKSLSDFSREDDAAALALIGIQAVNLVPKNAAGTAAGFVGLFGYLFGDAVLAKILMGAIANNAALGWDATFRMFVVASVLAALFCATTWRQEARAVKA